MKYDKVVIHDMTDAELLALPAAAEEYLIIDANDEKAAHCIGCFGCWLKTPGECVIADKLQHMGTIMGHLKKLVIISQNYYGGYSPGVKKVFDRSISACLPFFTYRKGEIHHSLRYHNQADFTVYLYGDINDFEKQIANELVQANSTNMGWGKANLLFVNEPSQALKEVW